MTKRVALWPRPPPPPFASLQLLALLLLLSYEAPTLASATATTITPWSSASPTPRPLTLLHILQRPDEPRPPSQASFDDRTFDFDIFNRLLALANVSHVLEQISPSGMTLFAPDDDAVLRTLRHFMPQLSHHGRAKGERAEDERAAADVLLALLARRTSDPILALRRTLAYHIVPRALDSNELRAVAAAAATLQMASGDALQVDVSHPALLRLVDAADHFVPRAVLFTSRADAWAPNGVLHVIDRMLLPEVIGAAVESPEPSEGTDETLFPELSPSADADVDKTPPPDASPEDRFPGDVMDDETPEADALTSPSVSSPPSTTPDFPPPSPETDPAVLASPEAPFPSPAASPPPSPTLELPSRPSHCFPAEARVHLPGGRQLPMRRLRAGLSVRTHESNTFSRVFLFSHRQHAENATFVRLITRAAAAAPSHAVELSPGHLIYANGRLVESAAVRQGDWLRTIHGPTQVVRIRWRVRQGLYAPHTMHGDLVVNGVVVSSYTSAVPPALAHWLLAPLRALVRMGIAVEPLGSLLYNGRPSLRGFGVRWPRQT